MFFGKLFPLNCDQRVISSRTINGLKESDASKDQKIKDLEEHLVLLEAKRLR